MHGPLHDARRTGYAYRYSGFAKRARPQTTASLWGVVATSLVSVTRAGQFEVVLCALVLRPTSRRLGPEQETFKRRSDHDLRHYWGSLHSRPAQAYGRSFLFVSSPSSWCSVPLLPCKWSRLSIRMAETRRFRTLVHDLRGKNRRDKECSDNRGSRDGRTGPDAWSNAAKQEKV